MIALELTFHCCRNRKQYENSVVYLIKITKTTVLPHLQRWESKFLPPPPEFDQVDPFINNFFNHTLLSYLFPQSTV